MLEKTRVLLALAADYEAQGAHAQAAQCLAAAAADASELPVVLAQARLRLASLLLAHFDNAPEAKAALLTAVSERRWPLAATPPPRESVWPPPAWPAPSTPSTLLRPGPLLPTLSCRSRSCGRRRATT